MRRTSIFTLFLALLLTATAAAQSTAQSTQVDEYVRAEMGKQRIPGLTLAVVKDGKIIKAEGYGLANAEHKIPARPETVFKIGSVSKQFIAVGVLLLAQDGKLSLGDPVKKHFPDAPETWSGITIRHLLLHTSGLPREGPGFDALKIQADADVIKSAYNSPLIFATGTKWEYCNLGYFMLAEIIQRVSGQPWGDFLAARVFRPLEMSATRTTTPVEVIPNRADGYVWRNDRLQNADEYRALRPSGAFISTVLDLAKWDAALYGDQILKAALREEMWKPAAETNRKLSDGTTDSYGYGWFIGKLEGHRQVFHGGSLPGFRAHLARFVDDRLTIIVLTNGDGARPEGIANSVAAFYLTEKKSGH